MQLELEFVFLKQSHLQDLNFKQVQDYGLQ